LLKIIFFFSGLLFIGCNANESNFITTLEPELEIISFDVVQKQLIIDADLPEHVQFLLSNWFDQRIKIDGFDGDLTFIVSDFSQSISSINNGKRVDVSMSFKINLDKPTLSQKNFIEGNISSYGTLTGSFSLNEFDTVIQNTQSDLILRLSKDLKSKI